MRSWERRIEIDDCQTCHSGRMEGGRLAGSSCDHCHDLLLHGSGQDARGTLNRFGLAYLGAGREQDALRDIEAMDSDGDGFPNREEILAGRYPGSGQSMPGQAAAPILTLDLDDLRALPSHHQFLLVNNTRQRFDDYISYRGVSLQEVFASEKIDLEGATGVTFIAPDGYQKSLPIDYVEKAFPRPVFHGGFGEEALGSGCRVVRYPEKLPDGVSGGSLLPGEFRLILA